MELALLVLLVLAVFLLYIFLAACWRILILSMGMYYGLFALAVMLLRPCVELCVPRRPAPERSS